MTAAPVPVWEEDPMDAIVEILMEMLGTAIVEGGVSAASNRRRPIWQRVLVLTLIALFFAAAFGLMAWAGVLMARQGRIAAAVCLFILDLLLIVLAVCKIRKILRAFSKK